MMKVERKMASRETTSVKKLKGYGSIGWIGKAVLPTIHPANQTTWAQTNKIDPHNRVMRSATISAKVCLACAAFSSFAMVLTFRSVSLIDGLGMVIGAVVRRLRAGMSGHRFAP